MDELPLSLGFLRGGMNACIEAYNRWAGRSVLNNWRRTQTRVDSFATIYKHMPPVVGPLSRVAFIEAAGGWTVVLGNQSAQLGVTTVIANITRQLKGEGVHLFMRDRPDASVPKFCTRTVYSESVFEHYRWKGPDSDIMNRSISLVYESKWEFDSWGEPLIFENQGAYSAACVPARVSKQVVIELLRNFDIELLDPNFYFTPETRMMVLRY